MVTTLHRVLNLLRSRPSTGLLLFMTALAGLVYRDLLLWDPSRPGLPDVGWFFFGANDTAPQIVFAIGALLLYRRRHRLARAFGGRGSWALGLPLLAAGTAVYVWAHYVDAPDLTLVSFLAFSLGSALLLSGRRFAATIALPILFLGFALPIPGALTNQIVFPLQIWNAEHAGVFLNAIGIPAIQEGDTLHLADASLEIIETCSGFRSMIILTMMAFVIIGFFPARKLHIALLIASAFLLAYCVNGIRILSLVLFPDSEVAASHDLQGVLIFIGGTTLLYGVDCLLRRWLGEGEPLARSHESDHLRHETPDPGRAFAAAFIALLLGSALAVSIWMPKWSAPKSREPAKINLPNRLGDWRATENLKLELQYLGSVQFRKKRYRLYERDGETVTVFVGYQDRLNRSRSVLSPKQAFAGRGWETQERQIIELGPAGREVTRLVARSRSRNVLSYYWYHGIKGFSEEVLRAWLATDRSFLRRPTGELVIRVSTPLIQTDEDKALAEARVREVAQLVLARFSDFDHPPSPD